MFTFSGLRTSLLFYFRLKNKSFVLSCFLTIRIIFAARADATSINQALLPKSSHWKRLTQSLDVIRKLTPDALYAWSRADVLEQRRHTGTNATASNLNSHKTISIISADVITNNRISLSAEKFSIGASLVHIYTLYNHKCSASISIYPITILKINTEMKRV